MSIQRIRTSIALLKSIIDKSAELHGEHADPVIVIVDTNEVIHYEIYPFSFNHAFHSNIFIHTICASPPTTKQMELTQWQWVNKPLRTDIIQQQWASILNQMDMLV